MTIEQLVIEHLTGVLDEPVKVEVPADPPETFVTVEKTGSDERNRILTSQLAVQSWAGSMLAAAELNERAKAAMASLTDLDAVTRVRCESDYNYTDTTTKHYRYQAVFAVTHYAI